MRTLPGSLKKISLFLERLPGIGEKTANRLSLYFLRLPEEDLEVFSKSVGGLKKTVKLCPNCHNLTENELCEICADSSRDFSVVTVVESVLDILSFESGNIYNGAYHVLHGRIDPLNHVSPEDIKIEELVQRVKKNGKIKEIILATNPDMEGEATAIYIKNKLHSLKKQIKITRLAYGLPIGANLEYADYMTLKKAIDGRNGF